MVWQEEKMKGILEGVRVIEFGPYVALPMTGRILAALGAMVIKVETNSSVDMMNFIPAWEPGAGQPEFQALKQRMTLDLSRPEAKPVFEKLVKVSDVLMTNFRRSVLSQWGIDFPQLREVNPKIIIIWQTGEGSIGPYGDYKVYGGLIQHPVGVSAMTGFGEVPAMVNISYSDYHCGIFQALAVVASLERRRVTGDATFVETSIFKSGTVTIGPALLDYQANGHVFRPIGNRDPCAAPHGVYRTQGEDRWCAIAAFTNEEWEGLCNAIDNPTWTKDTRFATLVDRIRNADDLDQLLTTWTVDHSAEVVVERMRRAGVPASIVAKGQDLTESPHLEARDVYKESPYYIPEIEKPGVEWKVGERLTIFFNIPVHFSQSPVQSGAMRKMGEDNEYICGELLGMPSEEIKALEDKHVLF